jgi:hypothetical protein
MLLTFYCKQVLVLLDNDSSTKLVIRFSNSSFTYNLIRRYFVWIHEKRR